jgi:hypothetical protein
VIERSVHDGPALLEIDFQTEVVGTQADHRNGEARVTQPA